MAASPLPLIWVVFRPDLYLNPVDRFFMTRFDDRTIQPSKSLTPEIFAQGIPQAELVRALRQFGYSEDPDRGEQPGQIWYRKEGPTSFVCGTEFFVQASFGTAGLQELLAYRAATCL